MNPLLGLHAVTGCDMTGSIFGIGKKRALKCFLDAPEAEIKALAVLGCGDKPNEDFICHVNHFTAGCSL